MLGPLILTGFRALVKFVQFSTIGLKNLIKNVGKKLGYAITGTLIAAGVGGTIGLMALLDKDSFPIFDHASSMMQNHIMRADSTFYATLPITLLNTCKKTLNLT